ncbi:MAG: hypothetical protein WBC44_22870 [Planctomycetaceae bacterium]
MTEAAVDGWREFLTAFDREHPVLAGEAVGDWRPGLRTELHAAGLLQELPAARSLACDGCPDAPFLDVVFTQSAAGRPRALLPCPHCGLGEVPLERLQRWQAERNVLIDRIGSAFGLTGAAGEIVAGRMWRLGRLRHRADRWSVWFGLRLARHDAGELMNRARPAPRTLLLVPGRGPSFALPTGVAVASLCELTSWSDGTIRWDEDLLDERLAGHVPPTRPSSKKAAPARRQSRAADIEALVAELSQHLRAARDHAFHTRDTQGAAALLPRPSQKELARRLGITESRVSRSLNDPHARQLQLLWGMAEDLDAILRHAAR